MKVCYGLAGQSKDDGKPKNGSRNAARWRTIEGIRVRPEGYCKGLRYTLRAWGRIQTNLLRTQRSTPRPDLEA